MKKLFGIAGMACVVAAGAPAWAQDCGDLTIASMNWQSAEVLANLDKFILDTAYGCNAEILVGDTVPSLTSMIEKGEPDLVPEAWVDLLPELINTGVKDGKIKLTGDSLSDGGVQGWWMPKYFADANPEIKTIEDVFAHPELFPDPEDPSKGAIYNGPQGWGGTIASAQLFKAFDGTGHGFNLIDTGSAAGLDGSIARAYERQEPWVGYYWAPTALMGRYDMVKLDHGVPLDLDEWRNCTSVADCAEPKTNDWPRDEIKTAVTTAFAEQATPEVIEYLTKRSWSNETVNKLMAWMTENQASGEAGAKHFLSENEDLWTQWVSPEAAEKIKAAL